MLDWLVIGGGIHGTHLSLVLTERLGVPRGRLRVLDPHAEPLARWQRWAANTGMRHLRSSSVHHLDIDPYSLCHFAKRTRLGPTPPFKYPYHRPGVDLFRLHCRMVVEKYGLDALRLTGRALGITRREDFLRVETDRGSIDARRILIAIGAGDLPLWPDWAQQIAGCGAPVHHLYDEEFSSDGLPGWSRLLVVGGGIGAAQAALKFAARKPGSVCLLMPHRLRINQFDSDPGWNGPRKLTGFAGESRPDVRREIIDRERCPGSIPKDVYIELDFCRRSDKLRVVQDNVLSATFRSDSTVVVETGRETLTFDRVVLATGFESKRPGGKWLDRAVEEFNLPCAVCGYPVTDRVLAWGERIHVSGPLAELELGPVARNIAGARHAGHRLFKYLR